MSDHLMHNYARSPVAFERGEGAWLWDSEGERYLDAISGLGVCALGHAHPAVARAVASQAKELVHTSNIFRIPWQEELADRLAAISGMERAFFGNSGTEMVECALKIARLWGHRNGVENPAVIVMDGSFHGRTLAALSATGNRNVHAGFEPLVSGFLRAPFDDVKAVEALAEQHRNAVAVLLEPIQGEGGVRLPSPGYLKKLRRLCSQRGMLLMLDEIQTGLCRTGKWYDHQYEGILPDVLTSAKALANGLPIGACLARGEAAKLMQPGSHGSTFGGNPLVSRAACATLAVMDEQAMATQSAAMGETMLRLFRERIGDDPRVRDIRGRGLMIGIELDRDAGPVKAGCMESRVIVNVTADKVIRLLPPLIFDGEQAERVVDAVCRSVERLD